MALSEFTKMYLRQDGFSEDDIESIEKTYDTENAKDLYEKFPGLVISSSGGACPFQAEGTIFGRDFYFRYRHGHATLDVGQGTSGRYGTSEFAAGKNYGHPLDGVLSWSEFETLFTELANEIAREIYA